MHHFFILSIIVKGNYWNSIIDLECKAIHTVVDDDYILEVPILKYPKILYIVALFGEETMLPIEAMCDILMVWVDVV